MDRIYELFDDSINIKKIKDINLQQKKSNEIKECTFRPKINKQIKNLNIFDDQNVKINLLKNHQ